MQQIDFSQGSIRRRILAVATPMLIAQLLNLLYNIVDRIYIGKIPGEGTLALASIGLCFPFVTLITAFATLFGLGGAPLCAMARGKGNRESAQGIMVNAGFMLLLSGAVLTVLGIAFHRPLLYLFGASEVTYPYASSYIVIYLIGTLCVMLSLGLNPYINCQGFARTGMLTVALGAAANIVLDPIFIFALHLGVRGAAIATVLSQLLSAAWVVKFLTSKKAELKLDFRGFRPDRQCIQRITVLGIASFVMSFTDTLVQVACNATLRNFGGNLYISVMTVLNSVRQIAQTPVLAIADGASTAISYNYGARLYRRTRDAIRFMTQIAIGYTMLVWILVSLFPALFIRIFN
ncbi:MAG: MATE family efflux transporter, partial [Butyricicoccus sp.]